VTDLSAATLPLVFVLGVATVLIVRARDVRAWQVAVIALFGGYLFISPVGWAVMAVVQWIMNGFLHN
jgi:NAD/NADP transhydrogenase beta subunit